MKQFPDILCVKNKDKFTEYYNTLIIENLREAIYKHMLKGDENSCFDFENFCRTQSIKLSSIIGLIKETIPNELESYGWKYKFAYGDTAIFIYSTENPPSSWYEEL